MKINCNQTETGIEVTVYDAPAACRSVISNDSDSPENNAKPVRIKRKFPQNLSPKKRETVCIALTQLFENYVRYHTIHQKIGKYMLIDTVKKDLSEKLNDYQLSTLNDIIPDICIPVCFEKSTYTPSQDDPPHTDAANTLCVALIGGFGYGKTTLIKSILDFDDTYRFLLVDGGRTTLCRTYIRAFIEDSEGNIHVPSEDNPKHRDEYLFQNRVTLYSADQAYVHAIIPALERSFQLYKSLLSDRTDKTLLPEGWKVDWKKVLKSFYLNEQFPLDSLFGNIPEDPMNDGSFYGKVVEVFQETAEPDADTPDFSDCLKESFTEKYKSALKHIKDNLEKVDVIDSGNSIHISFQTLCDDFAGNIDQFYQYFTDNKIKGNSLRAFVKEIYLETSFSGQHFDTLEDGLISLKSLKDGDQLKFHSILFVDTVGVGHIKKSQKDPSVSDMKYMSYDIDANLDILTDANVIVMLYKANQSMTESVVYQLCALENYGLMDKVVLAYSYYNQFIKMDMENDKDREDILLNLLLNSLRAAYPPVPPQDSEEISRKAKMIYDNLSQAVVFLKGLVPRENTSEPSNLNLKRKSSTRYSNAAKATQPIASLDDEKAEVLNRGFESSNVCLIKLIDAIVGRYEAYQIMKENKASIQSHYSERSFHIEYGNQVYTRLPMLYDQDQSAIYRHDPPAYNTTGALCRNASYGTPVHTGISMRLAPVADFCILAQHLISAYLDSTVTRGLEIRHDDAGHAYDKTLDQASGSQFDESEFVNFLNQEIKKSVSNKIRDLADTLMVSAVQNNWEQLAQDSGAEVKYRRANGIYDLLRRTTQLEALQEEIMNIVMDSISDIVKEYNT